MTALNVIAGPDDADPYSRHAARRRGRPAAERRAARRAGRRPAPVLRRSRFRPPPMTRLWRSSPRSAARSSKSISSRFTRRRGCSIEGPWVAERYLAVRDLLTLSPDAILPVTRQIIEAGATPTAADAFAAFYRLEELRRVRDRTFRAVDALVAPTAPTIYTIDASAGRSGRAQQPARHLYQFRQSARPVRACGAGLDRHERHAVRHHAARARRRRRHARRHRPAISARLVCRSARFANAPPPHRRQTNIAMRGVLLAGFERGGARRVGGAQARPPAERAVGRYRESLMRRVDRISRERVRPLAASCGGAVRSGTGKASGVSRSVRSCFCRNAST